MQDFSIVTQVDYSLSQQKGIYYKNNLSNITCQVRFAKHLHKTYYLEIKKPELP